MFGELSKLFDRSFAVGFFLPAFIFFSLSAFMLNQSIFHLDVAGFQEINWLVFATVLGLLSLLGGIVLLAANRDLYRLMEGYGSINPVKLFGWFEKQRYRSTMRQLGRLDEELLACLDEKTEFPAKSQQKRNSLMYRWAVEFPNQEEYLLPTPFGNALRSFEIFPYVMYGIDSISTWSRLLAIIPKEYVGMIDAVKSQVDFWVNLGLIFIFLQIEYIGLVFVTGGQLNWWIVGLWIVLGTIAPLRATSSAREWGDFVKSVFDLYRFELLDAMHIDRPDSRNEERGLWMSIGRAIEFRSPADMPELKKQHPPRKKSLLERFLKKF